MTRYTDSATAIDRHVTNEPTPFAMVPEALIRDAALSHVAVRLYAALLRHGDDPENCYPSHARLAEWIGCEERSIARPMRELEQAGWITRLARYRADGGRATNAYYVHRAKRADEREQSAQSSAVPDDPAARTQRAESRDERESVEREPVNDTRAQSLTLVSETADDELFTWDAFWKLYPRKIGKPQAERAFRRALGRARLDDLRDGLNRWVTYWRERNEPDFVPHAATWLNRDGWNDTPPALRKSQQQPKGPRWKPDEADDAAARARPSGRIVDL